MALRVFVGYDPREAEAYAVCRRSILKRATAAVEVVPIRQAELRAAGLYWRERGPLESTEFSFTRFLTPFLAGFHGWALFVDCDFLFLADVAALFALADDRFALLCVHHDYAPKETVKMDGAPQTTYPRKNWSSLVLYNCAHPKNAAALSPQAVSTRSGAFLHRFQWLDDADIGEIPHIWNFLVGHNRVVDGDPATYPKAVHYTSGGPWFDAYKDCDFAHLWLQELALLRQEQAREQHQQEHQEQEEQTPIRPPALEASVL
ncbi:nucleotide-diphospho-sugar transferases superfamily protein [Wolffia australiana]